MASEAELALILSAIDKGFAGTLNKAEKEVGGFGKTIGDVGKIASGFLAANVIQQGVGALTSGIGSSISAASNLGESINAVKVTFGDASQEILDWGKANSTSLGLSQRAFNELATPLGALLQNVGFGANEAGDQTRLLTQRAADMASVFNVDVSEALGAIQAGLKGEADPLERFGVGLSAAKVEAEALAMTGKSSAKALTDQEKAAARLNIIFKETAKTAGDFSNTSDGLANRQRILQARIENLQAKFGTFAAEVKAAVLGVLLNQVLPGVERFGTVMSKALSGPVSQAAGAIRGLVSALGLGSKAAGSFGGKTLTLSGPLGKLAGIIRTVVPQALAFLREKFAELQVYFESDIKPALENVKTAVVAVFEAIQPVLEKLIPIIEATIGAWVIIIRTYVGVITNILAIVIDLLQGDFAGAWKNLKDLINVVLDGIVDLVKNRIDLVLAIFDLGWAALTLLTSLAWDGIKALIGLAWDGIKEGISLGIAAVREYFETMYVDLPKIIVDLGVELAKAGLEAGKKLADGIIDGIGNLAERVGDKLSLAGVSASDLAGAGKSLFGKVIPGEALGGSNSGLTWVGENGPELLNLPPGSFVHDAARSRFMGGDGGGGVNVYIQGPVYARDEAEARRAGGDIGWALHLRRRTAAF
ncbi:MAG: hypothetical protein AB7P33_17080 [Dehalococcoidia bacterium]